ncbi:MAG: hypothetical protein M5R36_04300 [Deltaproteobacteria bacterium]|nr:hypothetical protein [Deltaproteobacteria bacterium]
MVEGGFVMQQGRGLDDDTPNFLRARQIAYAYIVDAIRKIREGNSAAATDRLLTVETLADGFLNTPVLIYTMIGVAITGILDNGMVAVLPVLSDTDLARLHDALAQRPQAAKTVVDAMAGEIVWLIESIDSLGAGDNSRKEVEILGRPTKEFKVGSLEWTMANVLGPLGYMKRERVKVLAFGASQMERYRAWLAAEGTDAPHILP